MSNLKVIVLAFIFGITLGTANARLGETKDQLLERYGEPFLENRLGEYPCLFFKKDEYVIMFILIEGKVESLVISKPTGFLDYAEVTVLLSRNSGGSGFVFKDGSNKGSRFFKEEDTGRKAILSPEEKGHTLSISTEKGNLLLAEVAVKKTGDKLKDF